MVELINRFKRFREKQQLKRKFRKESRDIEGRERLRRREIRLKELSEKEIEKQTRISRVREAQLRRAKAEAKILQAKAQRVKAIRQIRGPARFGIKEAGFREPSQRSVGSALMDFGPRPTIKKKKRRMEFRKQPPQRKTGVGIGTSFRVL